ncbi:MAG: hypothetical protein IH971_06990 [Candidatus Marinimicrobia bacterium]|nr:hypothetical protein [Candidatus Neomarinimicrobiota bacterium]
MNSQVLTMINEAWILGNLSIAKSFESWEDLEFLQGDQEKAPPSSAPDLLDLLGYSTAHLLSQFGYTWQIEIHIAIGHNLTGGTRVFDYPQESLFVSDTASLDAEMLGKIGERYNLADPETFYEFVAEFEFLMESLLDAYPHLQSHFGEEVRIDLVVRTDVEDEYKELFGYISSSLSADDAQACLDEFDREWFLEHSLSTKGRLNFDISFR